jgi:hypothetical protein
MFPLGLCNAIFELAIIVYSFWWKVDGPSVHSYAKEIKLYKTIGSSQIKADFVRIMLRSS